MPYYFITIEQATLQSNKNIILIAEQFNTALFINKQNFINSLGYNGYRDIIYHYKSILINKIRESNLKNIDWIGLYNTFISFDDENFDLFYDKIFTYDEETLASILLYLSVIVFQYEDNIFNDRLKRMYMNYDLWLFESSSVDTFFWNSKIISIFDKKISLSLFKNLFVKLKKYLFLNIGMENYYLIQNELDEKYIINQFEYRKGVYLSNHKGTGLHKYWELV